MRNSPLECAAAPPPVQVTAVAALGERALVGTAGGSLHLLDLVSGKPLGSHDDKGLHDAGVAAITASEVLRHFVSCCSDGCVKVCGHRGQGQW